MTIDIVLRHATNINPSKKANFQLLTAILQWESFVKGSTNFYTAVSDVKWNNQKNSFAATFFYLFSSTE